MNSQADMPRLVRELRERMGLVYDEACRTLVDLSEAYAIHASRKRFQKELRKFMANHMRRKALIQRPVKTDIWNEK